jgi:hypothetical protein
MRRKLKFMQLATIISMAALAVVHFTYLNKPVLSSFADLKQSANSFIIVNGKNTPITKTKQKLRYPTNEAGFQYQMGMYKTRICYHEIEGVTSPVLITGIFSGTEKMVVLVRTANDELNKKLALDKFRSDHSGEAFADYILVQQRSFIEILLTTVVIILGLKLIAAGLKRAQEIADA